MILNAVFAEKKCLVNGASYGCIDREREARDIVSLLKQHLCSALSGQMNIDEYRRIRNELLHRYDAVSNGRT